MIHDNTSHLFKDLPQPSFRFILTTTEHLLWDGSPLPGACCSPHRCLVALELHQGDSTWTLTGERSSCCPRRSSLRLCEFYRSEGVRGWQQPLSLLPLFLSVPVCCLWEKGVMWWPKHPHWRAAILLTFHLLLVMSQLVCPGYLAVYHHLKKVEDGPT